MCLASHNHVVTPVPTIHTHTHRHSIVDVALSDHYFVFFEISVCSKSMSDKKTFNKHYLTADSATTFMELMSSKA